MNRNTGLSRSMAHLSSSGRFTTISSAFAALLVLRINHFDSSQDVVTSLGATLSGTVSDTSGANLPQAQISVTNTATGVSTTTPSNSDGFYSVPNLLPGSYEVKASAPGFSTAVRTGITLTVGAQQVLNLTLTVGQMTQTVQVTTEAPTVELASSTIGGVLGSTTVVELPLNGRSWLSVHSSARRERHDDSDELYKRRRSWAARLRNRNDHLRRSSSTE